MLTAGLDETGRGSCFGPLVTCAVVFPPEGLAPELLGLLRDSKKMSARQRERLFAPLSAAVQHGYGCASAREVDVLNPLRATMLAMGRAVAHLPVAPEHLLVDGLNVPDIGIPGEAIVKGDDKIPEIQAASILAKVFRDRLIGRLAPRHPVYGLEKHAGYGTKAHFDAVVAWGPTRHHRLTFLKKPLALREALV